MKIKIKFMKAITPVIALVMLMLITVGMVGISYAWFSGLFSSTTNKAISIPAGGAYCEGGDVKVYVLNSGDSAITAGDIIVANVDGVDVKNTPFFGDMKTGLAGYWKFDEGAGAVAADSSGNGNNGNLLPSCPNCPARTLGKSRNALLFDGVNDYVQTANKVLFTTEFTIGVWFNSRQWTNECPNPDYSMDVLISKWDRLPGNIDVGYRFEKFYCSPTFGIAVSSGTDTNSVSAFVPIANVSTNAWHHAAATFKGGSFIRLYLDGKLANENIAGIYPQATDAANFPHKIGIMSHGYGLFNGTIDEVRIYNKTNGDVNIQPGNSGLVINYPGAEGRHTVRIGTSSGAAETTVACA